MKGWLKARSLVQRLTFINCLCILILAVLLWYSMYYSMQRTAVQTREREAELRASQTVTQAERTAELCNMSTQVFLNTPALLEHLEALKRGETFDTVTLMQFYRQVIGSLEKIVLSNPDLYQIRVYSDAANIQEMMPILYGADRMMEMPWKQDGVMQGGWYFDFSDELMSTQADHLMGLATDVETSSMGHVGVLEVMFRLEDILPVLLEKDAQNYSALVDAAGQVLVGRLPAGVDALPEAPTGDPVLHTDGQRMLFLRQEIKSLGCTYVQFTSLHDIDASMSQQALILLTALLLGFLLIAYLSSRLIQRMLRGFYGAFDGMRAFAAGEVDTRVEVRGQDEVAKFAAEVNGLMDKIRELMHDNLMRQSQAQSMESRALHNQINAHFIYNVLEAIKMMAEIDERFDIADAVTSLGKLLRYSMKWESGNVFLSKELEYIENYLALMNLRFDYVITTKVEVPDAMLTQRLPKISLQPIVENAVVHGAAILTADTSISIIGTIDREHGRCQVAISDEGQGMDEQQLMRLRAQIEGAQVQQSSSGNGIGLHNVHSRIQHTFGTEYGLTVTSVQGQGTTVTVTLPYREKEESA